jgi:hypothetical protein
MVRDGPQVGVAAAALWRLTENTVLQMKDSLINLQNGIRSRDYTAESDEKRNRYH